MNSEENLSNNNVKMLGNILTNNESRIMPTTNKNLKRSVKISIGKFTMSYNNLLDRYRTIKNDNIAYTYSNLESILRELYNLYLQIETIDTSMLPGNKYSKNLVNNKDELKNNVIRLGAILDADMKRMTSSSPFPNITELPSLPNKSGSIPNMPKYGGKKRKTKKNNKKRRKTLKRKRRR